MEDPILSQIEELPVEAQVTWLSKLTIPDLLSVYEASRKLRRILNNKEFLRFISQNNEIETWYDFIISELSLLTPSQLYEIYNSNENVRPYMNDLRIIINFVVPGTSFSFYRKRKFTIDDVIDSIKTFALSHHYSVDDLLLEIDSSYIQPVQFINDKIIIDEPITNNAIPGRIKMGTTCNTLPRLVILNILQRTGHNIIEYINYNKSQLCSVLQAYAMG
jgi:hypothetical protein